MRPVSSRLILAVAGIASLTMAGAEAWASPGGGHAGLGHSRGGHAAAYARAGHSGARGLHIRTVGRGYGAGDFGRGSLGRGYGSTGHFGRHGRFGHFGPAYGLGGFDQVLRFAYGGDTPGSAACCFEAYPTASGIRAAPVAPPAIYVIGGRGRHGHLRRPVRGGPLEADSAMVGYPSGVVSSGGARIIRVP